MPNSVGFVLEALVLATICAIVEIIEQGDIVEPSRQPFMKRNTFLHMAAQSVSCVN